MSAGNRAYYSIGSPSAVHASSVARLVEMGAQLVGMTKTYAFAAVRSHRRASQADVAAHRRLGRLVRLRISRLRLTPMQRAALLDARRRPALSIRLIHWQRRRAGLALLAGHRARLRHRRQYSSARGRHGTVRHSSLVRCHAARRRHPALREARYSDLRASITSCADLTPQFARSPQLFADFGRVWYGDALRLKDAMPRVIYVEREYLSDHAADRQLETVLQAVAAHLGVRIVPVSIEEVWKRTQPGTLAGAMVKSNGRVGTLAAKLHRR